MVTATWRRWLRGVWRNLASSNNHQRKSHRVRVRLRFEVLEDRLAPAVYTVNAITDTGTGTGLTGDLRYCINQSNSDSGPDTIQFQPGQEGVIDLSTTEGGQGTLTISNNVTIDGFGVIEGGGNIGSATNAQPFVIDPGVTAVLNNLTIINGVGSDGGGITNHGTLTVSGCFFSGNTGVIGGAIDNDGTLIVSNSFLSRNYASDGGGIWNTGAAAVTNSFLSGNISAYGGGIWNSGSATVSVCTLSGNSASGAGGIWNSGNVTVSNSTLEYNVTTLFGGGGIANDSGTVTITNTTLAENSAQSSVGGGIENDFGTVTVSSSTISDNSAYDGGGISNEGNLNLTNTIVANNSGGSDLDDFDPIGTAQNNLIQSENYNDIQNGVNGNIVGLDPHLSSLDYYGGPTPTIALLPGSPAIGTGNPTLIPDDPATGQPYTTDQRGQPRLSGETLDIGAFESQPQLLVVNTTSDNQTTAFGQMSLRQAITLANVQSGNNNVTFDNTVFATPQTITLTEGLLALDDTSGTTTIQGPGANLLTIDGNHNTHDFLIYPGVNAVLDSLTIANGKDFFSGESSHGGGIDNYGNLTLNNSTISGNSATNGDGGGIWNSGAATISNCTLAGNSAPNGEGGGIWNSGTLTVGNSTLEGNTAGFAGGGIFNSGILTIDQGAISDNSCILYGGGIDSDSGSVTISNTTLSDNFTTSTYVSGIYGPPFGGGIANGSGTLTISNSTLSGNSTYLGGGIMNGGMLTVSNSTFSGNTATNDAGGIYNNFGAATISNSTLSDNTAAHAGGGIVNDFGILKISNSTFAGNIADNGGGGGIVAGGTVTISNTTLADNEVPNGNGGAIYSDGALTVGNDTIAGNSASGDGSGIYNDYGSLNLMNTIVANNPTGVDLYNAGTIATAQNNLIGSENTDDIQNGVNGNIVGQDPLLSPLGSYGGPIQTVALLPGSPALGTGNPALIPNDPATNSPCTMDQRGFPRVVNGQVDIGAFESQPHPLLVNTTADGLATGLGQLSLRQAIALATVRPGNDTITFDSTVFANAQTITLTDGALALTDTSGGTTTIEGPGANLLAIDGNHASIVFLINPSVNAMLDGLTIANGNASFGGGIDNEGTLTVSNSVLTSNSAHDGGGIYNSGVLNVINTVFSGNSANTGAGGGIDNESNLTVSDSTLKTNSAYSGGGIYNSADMATVSNSTLSSNSAHDGGGTYNSGFLNVINSAISGNSASYGGGIDNESNLTVSDSTLNGNFAYSGGGIYNDNDTATVSNSSLSSNVASYGAGIYNRNGTAMVSNSTLSSNSAFPGNFNGAGGGIYNYNGTITASNSTLIANSAFFGGGIFNYNVDATAMVSNSTLSYNSASYAYTNGNGIDNYVYGSGGGICNVYGTATISNSTLASNSAYYGGGLCNDTGTATISNSTIAGDSAPYGGGIYNASVLNLMNSIVANSPTGVDLYNSATIATAENNLIGSENSNAIQNGVNGNIVGQDPHLSPLGNYGGPTQTMALLPGSPALGKGNLALIPNDPATGLPYTTDQRGLLRTVNGQVDIGAFESQPLVVNTTADSPPTSFGQLSLRQAIVLANIRLGDDTITFDSTVFATPQTITLRGGVLALTDTSGTTTIQGPGDSLLTISGNYASTVFLIDPGVTTLLDSLSIADGQSYSGGGIVNKGNLTLSNSILSGNSASYGAGIYNYFGTAKVSASTLFDNSASRSGGGIYNYYGTTTIGNSSLAGNSAYQTGGGIYNYYGTATIGNSTLSGNHAPYGGGIYNYGGTATISNSTLSDNSASNGVGGGILNFGAVTVSNSTVADNSAGAGGGIYNDYVLNLTNTIIANNLGGNAGRDLFNVATIATARYNLIQSALDYSNIIQNGTYGNIVGLDPQLSPLGDYGGPTQTFALLSGSPAIDAGNSALVPNDPATGLPYTTDQRGDPRIVGNAVDIGAFESAGLSLEDLIQTVLSPSYPVIVIVPAGSTTDGNEVIDAVNQLPSYGSPVTVTLNLAVGASLGDVAANPAPGVTLVINGLADGQETIVGASPALTVTSGTVIVTGMTLTTATDAPTILVTGGSLTLRNDTIQESPGFDDAAISIMGGAVDLGTVSDPGNNTVNINGVGAFINNSTTSAVSAVGETFLVNGITADRWTGDGSDNLWSDPANWLGASAPEPGDVLTFDGTPQTTVNDFPDDTAFGGIRFLSPSGFGPDLPTWQVSGNEVVLSGSDAILSDPSPAGSEAVVYFNLPVQLSSDITVRTTSADSAFEMSDVDTAGHTLSVDAQGEVYLTGAITGSGGLVLKEGFLLLEGNNSYTGPTILQAGTVHADTPTAFGDGVTGTEVQSGVNLQVSASLAEPLTLDAGSTLYLSNPTLVLSGALVSHGGEIATVGGQITGSVTLDGAIYLLTTGPLFVSGNINESSPDSSLAIGGNGFAGTVDLSGICTYTGTTDVYNGTLQVDGILNDSGGVYIDGATLDGSGAISANVYGNGTINPGNVSALGTLSINGDCQSSGTLTCTIAGPHQLDQVNVSGNVDLLGCNLQVTLASGYTPTVGTQFEIINNTGSNTVTNTIAGLPEGSFFTAGSTEFSISYAGGDGNDVVLTVVQGVVINTDDDGPGSLRQAILDANANPGADVITFDIPGSGAHTIQPLSPLPTIADPVTIDGWSQPGYVGTPLIEINGSLAGGSDGLIVTAANTTLRGLVINSFAGNGVDLYGPGSDVLQGSYVGTDVLGAVSMPNGGVGVLVESSSDLIGTDGDGVNDATEDNLISGNHSYGVMIAIGSGNVIAGNRIGTDLTGTQALANGSGGIWITAGANGNLIGTDGNDIDNVGERNLISGNNQNFVAGITIDAGCSNNVVAGNFIGTDVTGTQSLPNSGGGMDIGSDQNFIGTNALGVVVLDENGTDITRNVISGNDWAGITLAGNNNVMAGNYIGTDPSGLHWNGNFGDGIITFGAEYNQIGANGDGVNDAVEGNVISGNTSSDIWLDYASAFNVIAGNLIGTDVTGTLALTANFAGIGLVHGSHDNLIGGTGGGIADTADRNVISGHSYGIYSDEGANTIAGNLVGTDINGLLPLSNVHDIAIWNGSGSLIEQNLISGAADLGIWISGLAATGNVVAGNWIGTDITGNSPLSNGGVGVYFDSGASNNTIGGTTPGTENTIAFNNSGGVAVSSGNGNAILGNSIHDNGGLGIILAAGANDQQSYPTLTGAIAGATTSVSGTLSSTPDSTFTLEFYASATADPSGYGQGQIYLGSTIVTTDANGNVGFVADGLNSIAAGDVISATATDANGSTSQFAADISASALAVGAGGLYAITAGSSITLASSASDPLGVVLTYSWTINGHAAVASGANPTLTWAQLQALGIDDGPADFALSVVVDDGHGHTAASPAATLALSDTPPTATLNNNGPVVYGNAFTASFANPFDPSATDTAAGFHYAFNLSANALASATYAGSGTTASQAFNLPAGTYTVYGRIIDKHDGYTQYQTTITVNQDATTTAVTTSVTPSVLYQAVTFTATVSPNATGAGTPTGTVTFMDGAITLGTVTLNAVSGIDQASFTTSALGAGAHSITAVYGADTNFIGSTSSVLSQTVATTPQLQNGVLAVPGTALVATYTLTPILPTGASAYSMKITCTVGSTTTNLGTFAVPSGTIEIYGGPSTDAVILNGTANSDDFIAGSGMMNELVAQDTTQATNFNVGLNAVTALTLKGAGGSDSLTAPNLANAWTLTGANAGTLGSVAAFSGIDNLIGGTGNDTFAFDDGGSVSGMINGGGGSNTLDFSARTTAVTITMEASGPNKATAISGWTNIATVIGSAAPTNTLVGADTTNTWDLDGANAGSLDGTLAFSGFQNLTGGATNDTFAFLPGGSIAGNLKGGAPVNTLDYSSYAGSVAINLQAKTATAISGTWTNVQSFIGTGTTGALDGANANSTWSITGVNAGTVGAYSFAGFPNLTGGTGNDDFKFISPGALSGTINGGGGNDAVTGDDIGDGFTVSGSNSGVITAILAGGFSNIQNLTGGAGNDRFAFVTGGSISGILSGGAGNNTLDDSGYGTPVTVNLQAKSATAISGTWTSVQNFIGSGTTDTLDGANANSTWSITGVNTGTVGAYSFAGFPNLTGGSGNDTFAFNAGALVAGAITGGGGTNTLDYTSFGSPVTVNLQTTTANQIGHTWGNIQRFKGTNTTDNLIATDGTTNTWALSGSNAGNVDSVVFTGFANLTGGSGADVFQFANGATVLGVINGETGANTLDYSAYTGGVTVNLGNATTDLANSSATGVNAGTANGISNIGNVVVGAGNNYLTAVGVSTSVTFIATGNGNNILVGGSASNTLTASGSGHNIVIGGQGTSTINGGTGYNLLIGGYTSYDAVYADLESILSIWESVTSTTKYAQAISELTASSYAYSLSTTSVYGNSGDTINAGTHALDWYFTVSSSEITGEKTGETVSIVA
jgi:Bacterial Ig-like domain (group 3)/Right handed beta helix region